jgi:multiple antibiotic resistance protein
LTKIDEEITDRNQAGLYRSLNSFSLSGQIIIENFDEVLFVFCGCAIVNLPHDVCERSHRAHYFRAPTHCMGHFLDLLVREPCLFLFPSFFIPVLIGAIWFNHSNLPVMFSLQNILTISLTLFLVIDILGSVPIIISIKRNTGALNPAGIVIFAGALMIAFTLIGEALLRALGIEVKSFAIAGAVVLLLLALEMILGATIFRAEGGEKSGNLVPIGFPILAGVGTLTTILSLRTQYSVADLLVGITLNLLIIFLVLLSMNWLERKLGNQVLTVMKKLFGILLLALAVQMFLNNI